MSSLFTETKATYLPRLETVQVLSETEGNYEDTLFGQDVKVSEDGLALANSAEVLSSFQSQKVYI